jgi:hypothetical protein
MGRQTFAKITNMTVALCWMLVGITFSVLGCKDSAQPWQSFGEITTETRPLADFTKIYASHNIQLFITQDTSKPSSIQITYGKNTLAGITSEIKDGELIIDDMNQAKWLRNLNTLPLCTLNIHQINKIHLEGNAKLTCIDTLRTPALEFTVNSVGQQQLLIHCGQLYGGIQNSGYVKAAGTATIFSWSCEKGSGIDARNLLSDDVYMRHFTIQDVFVNPSKQFEAYAYNSGSIYYFQTPSYKFKVVEEGSGKVKLYQP